MLEAPALSARRVGTMFIPYPPARPLPPSPARACSSPRLPLRVALTHACSTTSARALLHHGLGSASPAPLLHLHLHPCTHHTHVTACHTRSPLQLQRPCPTETRSSCLHAAIAFTSNLIGGIPRPLLEISVASSQPSASTYVVTFLYDHSDCCDACSGLGLPASLSARCRLLGHVRRERDLDTLCRG